jgi:hypothetical protein
LHWRVAWTRAALALAAAGAVWLALVSGGSVADPRTPPALPGQPPPFLGTAVVGGGGLTAAIDAYGDVVDLRVPGPAGRALIDNPADRQAAGTVSARTGIAPRVSVGGVPALPLWRADSVSQRYLRGTNVVRTVARFGSVRVTIVYAARRQQLACLIDISGDGEVWTSSGDTRAARRLHCEDGRARGLIRGAARADRRWLARARPLGPGAPAWARRMYRRSLLTLLAARRRHRGARLRRRRLPARGAPRRRLPARCRPPRGGPLPGRRHAGAGTRGPGRRFRLGHRRRPSSWPPPSHPIPPLARPRRLPRGPPRRLSGQRHRRLPPRWWAENTPIWREIGPSTSGGLDWTGL